MNRFNHYDEALQWMINKLPMYQRIGGAAYRADLHNTIALLQHLGNPEKKFKSVHIAGTNGKGSVSHMLASVMACAGYKTGLYTSPHLRDFRERIKINGEMIEKPAVLDFINQHHQAFEQMDLSFFEMTVGMAFHFFAEQKVDVAVIETGMGGRLDSTNLITPLLSVITNIGFDHMQFLGDTLEAIAMEKAGIIKPGVPVVVGQTQQETENVFRTRAAELQSPIFFADQIFDATRLDLPDLKVQEFDLWKNNLLLLDQVKLPLLGYYQQKNLITAACAADQLRRHFDIEDSDLRDGLEMVVYKTGLSGRWQIISRSPLAIADTGHNEDGIREVVYQLREMRYGQLHFVLGVVNDKAVDAVLHLLPRPAKYYFCKANIPRGLDASELKNKAAEAGLSGQVYESVTAAYRAALDEARPNDLVFVGGSTFVVAEVV